MSVRRLLSDFQKQAWLAKVSNSHAFKHGGPGIALPVAWSSSAESRPASVCESDAAIGGSGKR